MTDNVVDFVNPDEVLSEEDQDDRDYNNGWDAGYAQGQRALFAARELTKDMNDAEIAGFWDGFYD